MFRVSIYDKSKKILETYEHIKTINYTNEFLIDVSISGEDLLTYKFPTNFDLQLLSSDGCNYLISGAIIGAIEIRSMKK